MKKDMKPGVNFTSKNGIKEIIREVTDLEVGIEVIVTDDLGKKIYNIFI